MFRSSLKELSTFHFLNSSFRSLYGAFLLQFSFVLPLAVAIADDERRYSAYLEGYLVFLNCAAIPALFVLHYVLWRVNHVSVHRWIYDKCLRLLRGRRRRKSRTGAAGRPGETTVEEVPLSVTNTNGKGEKQAVDTTIDLSAQDVDVKKSLIDEENDGEKQPVAERDDFKADSDEHLKSENTQESATNGDDVVRMRTPTAPVEKKTAEAEHAAEPITGPDVMMRIGAFGFGFAGLVLNILRISDRWTKADYYENCRTSVSTGMYICYILFYFAQTYFLFKHQSHRFPRANKMVRFLLLHLIVTNIALWINAVVVEVTEDLHERTFEFKRGDKTQLNESYLSIKYKIDEQKIKIRHFLDSETPETRRQFLLYYCHSEEVISLSAATYLFPLMVEYFIISASILCKIYLSSYTMAESHKSGKRSPQKHKSKSRASSKRGTRSVRSEETNVAFVGTEDEDESFDEECVSCEKSCTGFIAGIVMLVIAVASIVSFLVVLAQKKTVEEYVLEVQAGKEENAGENTRSGNSSSEHAAKEASTRSIETGAKEEKENETSKYDAENEEEKLKEAEETVKFDTLVALLIYQCGEMAVALPPLVASVLLLFKFRAHFNLRVAHRSERIDVQQLFIGYIGVLTYNTFILIATFERASEHSGLRLLLWIGKSLLSVVQSTLQIAVIMRGFRSILPHDNPVLQEKKPGRSLVAFLILSNLALWAMNTFQMKYIDQVPDLYRTQSSITPWSIITHLLIPFTIFFRFHSTISLLHIWHVDFEDASTHDAIEHKKPTPKVE